MARGLAHMGPTSLNLRPVAGPRGWSAGACSDLCWKLIRQAGTKRLVAPTPPPPTFHLFYPNVCKRERERRKRKFEFGTKKLAKNYLTEDDEFVASGLGRTVRFTTLTGRT